MSVDVPPRRDELGSPFDERPCSSPRPALPGDPPNPVKPASPAAEPTTSPVERSTTVELAYPPVEPPNPDEP